MAVAPGETKVGWIGLGVMGSSMCGHLIDAGVSATVYTRSKAKADGVLAKGAQWADSPKAVAEQSDVIFSIVGFPADVREVMLGADGRVLVRYSGTEAKLRVMVEAADEAGIEPRIERILDARRT